MCVVIAVDLSLHGGCVDRYIDDRWFHYSMVPVFLDAGHCFLVCLASQWVCLFLARTSCASWADTFAVEGSSVAARGGAAARSFFSIASQLPRKQKFIISDRSLCLHLSWHVPLTLSAPPPYSVSLCAAGFSGTVLNMLPETGWWEWCWPVPQCWRCAYPHLYTGLLIALSIILNGDGI